MAAAYLIEPMAGDALLDARTVYAVGVVHRGGRIEGSAFTNELRLFGLDVLGSAEGERIREGVVHTVVFVHAPRSASVRVREMRAALVARAGRERIGSVEVVVSAYAPHDASFGDRVVEALESARAALEETPVVRAYRAGDALLGGAVDIVSGAAMFPRATVVVATVGIAVAAFVAARFYLAGFRL